MRKLITIILLFCAPVLFGQRISELPAATTAANGNLFLIVQGGVTKKIDFQYLQTALAGIPVSVSGDTLFIGTDTIVFSYGIYVSYECDPLLNSGTRNNGDTVYINTCYVDGVDVIDNVQFPMEYLRYSKESEWDTVTTMIKPHGIMAGGYVTWIQDTTFIAESCAYFIYGDFFYSPQTEILINSGDPTNPRIDIVVVDTLSAVSVIEGVPGVDPAKPQSDPISQIELTQIYVPAGATDLDTNYDREIIYDENMEWTGGSTGVTVDFGNATDPFHGDSCVSVGTITTNDIVSFTGVSPVSHYDYEIFTLAIRLKEAAGSKDYITVQFYNGAVVASNAIRIDIDKSLTTWQIYSIPLLNYIWYSDSFNEVIINNSMKTANFDGYYLDLIKLENGTPIPTFENSIILSGDITGTGVTGAPVNTTLASVNSNVGSFGASDTTLTIQVDAKGRILSVTKNAISFPASLETDPKYATDSSSIFWFKDTTGLAYQNYPDQWPDDIHDSLVANTQGFLTEEIDPQWVADSADYLYKADSNAYIATHKWVNDQAYLTALPASAVEWSDTTASSGVGIATYADIQGLTESGLEWADTTASAGVGVATFYDLRTGPFNGTLGATTPNTIVGTTIQANTGFIPDADDGAYLGTTSAQFSDLFLAEGGVINWDNGDATLTQANNVVTLAGADLVVDAAKFNTSAGYDAVPSNTPSSNAVTIDWTSGNVQALVYNDTCTFTFTAPPLPCHLTLIMTHAANTTVFPCTWPTGASGVKWAGGTAITPTATSSAVDIVSFFYNGTAYYGMFGTDFK